MLETLSENRQLQSNIKEAKTMLSEIDIKKLPSYNWGLERGLEQGLEQGGEKKAIEIACKMFPLLDDMTIANLTGLAIETVKSLRKSKSN